MSYMLDKDGVALFKVTRPTKQILRLNAFMSLAMRQIDQIRVKYRPNGFICSLPRGWWILRLVRSLHAYQDGQPINSRHRSSAHTRNAVRSAVAGPPAASVCPATKSSRIAAISAKGVKPEKVSGFGAAPSAMTAGLPRPSPPF